MAFLKPSKDELVSELGVILDLEGETIPEEDQKAAPDTWLNKKNLLQEPYEVIRKREYHIYGINLYQYSVKTEEQVSQCLLEDRLRVVLDNEQDPVLDTSISPKDFLTYYRGRPLNSWVSTMHTLYVSVNFT